jgi:glycosyltransferase involved in cell wall biosynthesis
MTPGMVSVVMPVRNGALYLGQALTCILRQNYQPLEICLVDDASTDDTARIAQAFPGPVRCLHGQFGKPSAARNLAIAEARGEFIAFLDFDDLWAEGHLARALDIFAADPGVGIVQGQARNWRCGADGLCCYCSGAYVAPVLMTSVFRRALFDTVGLLDPTLRFGEDSDFYIRCWEACVRKSRTGRMSLYYRRHANNMTARKNLTELGLVQVYKRRLDRIRQGQVNLDLPREENLRDFLGAPPAVYDDGSREEVGEEILAYQRLRAPEWGWKTAAHNKSQ